MIIFQVGVLSFHVISLMLDSLMCILMRLFVLRHHVINRLYHIILNTCVLSHGIY